MEERRTRVLTNWQPSALNAYTIKEEFRLLVTVQLNYRAERCGVSTRSPRQHNELSTYSWYEESINFHHDASGCPGDMVMWSNRLPTEVRFEDGSILEAADGDVIFVDNLEVMHRIPNAALTPDNNRWFARQRLDNFGTVRIA